MATPFQNPCYDYNVIVCVFRLTKIYLYRLIYYCEHGHSTIVANCDESIRKTQIIKKTRLKSGQFQPNVLVLTTLYICIWLLWSDLNRCSSPMLSGPLTLFITVWLDSLQVTVLEHITVSFVERESIASCLLTKLYLTNYIYTLHHF